MNKEDKSLLVKDLCARMPYAVIVEFQNGFRGVLHNIEVIHLYNDDNETDYVDDYLASIDFFGDNDKFSIEDFKPCLIPFESMTEEQKQYISDRWGINENFNFEIDPNWGEYFVDLRDAIDYINWLNENHFDYRGLIPKGLAVDATDKNIY
jgi:hypothetical protein